MFLVGMFALGISTALLAEFPLLLLISSAMITVGFAFAGLAFAHGYFLYHEYRYERTPGKKVFGIKVVSVSSSPLDLERCIYRELLRYVDVLLLIPGFVFILRDENGQRLGDRVAETMVVYELKELDSQNYRYMPSTHFEKMTQLCPVLEIPNERFQYFLDFAYRCLKDRKLDLINSREALAWEVEVRHLIQNQDRYEIDRPTLFAYFAETLYQRSSQEPFYEPNSAA